MNVFDDYMTSIYLQYNLVLAVILFIFGFNIALWMPRGWLSGVAGFFASIVGAAIVVAIAILVMALSQGAAFIPGLPMIAWAFEAGLEFAIIPILLCPVAFVIGRIKREKSPPKRL
jgi:hypothetical protein